MTKLFVYGTLLKGQRNHYILAGQQYLGTGELNGFKRISLGG